MTALAVLLGVACLVGAAVNAQVQWLDRQTVFLAGVILFSAAVVASASEGKAK